MADPFLLAKSTAFFVLWLSFLLEPRAGFDWDSFSFHFFCFAGFRNLDDLVGRKTCNFFRWMANFRVPVMDPVESNFE